MRLKVRIQATPFWMEMTLPIYLFWAPSGAWERKDLAGGGCGCMRNSVFGATEGQQIFTAAGESAALMGISLDEGIISEGYQVCRSIRGTLQGSQTFETIPAPEADRFPVSLIPRRRSLKHMNALMQRIIVKFHISLKHPIYICTHTHTLIQNVHTQTHMWIF